MSIKNKLSEANEAMKADGIKNAKIKFINSQSLELIINDLIEGRCKDCKYFKIEEFKLDRPFSSSSCERMIISVPRKEDYCSMFEPKEKK